MKNDDLSKKVLHKLDTLLDLYLSSARAPDPSQYHAFFWNGSSKGLSPVVNTVSIPLSRLIGIEDHKKKVVRNTLQFLKGKKTNNVLLWGERGTGKSSLVKSLLGAYARKGLRMIQVFPHDILTIQSMYGFLRGHPGYKFVIFIDDLSFEEHQQDYKELKTIIDGGIEELPENMVFYATSNRKHLITTRFSDASSDETRPSDTVEEKISLAERFGLKLGFFHISQETYLDIVDVYAELHRVRINSKKLHRLALQWSLEAGGRNGRVAEQFVKSL